MKWVALALGILSLLAEIISDLSLRMREFLRRTYRVAEWGVRRARGRSAPAEKGGASPARGGRRIPRRLERRTKGSGGAIRHPPQGLHTKTCVDPFVLWKKGGVEVLPGCYDLPNSLDYMSGMDGSWAWEPNKLTLCCRRRGDLESGRTGSKRQGGNLLFLD
jgi:hypothetical protein